MAACWYQLGFLWLLLQEGGRKEGGLKFAQMEEMEGKISVFEREDKVYGLENVTDFEIN